MTIEIDFAHADALIAPPRMIRPGDATMQEPLAAFMRGQPDVMRWSGSGVVALLAHAAVAGAFYLHLPPKPIVLPPAAMDVEIVAPMASPQSVATAAPPGPEQVQTDAQPEPTPEQVEIPKFEPPPVEKIPIPDAVVLRQIDPKPKVSRPAPNQKVAERTSAQPNVAAKPATVAAAPRAGAPSASPSDAELSWEQQMLARIEREKRYPGEARQQSMEDYVTVRFIVDRQGKVLSAHILHSNGYAPFDNEALAIFQRVSLPAPPDDAKGQTLARQVRIHFFPPRHG